MTELDAPQVERFWAKVQKTDDCWLWIGAKNSNSRVLPYGRFLWHGKVHVAHRVSWWIAGRDIPSGYELDHLCRNASCVNPDHLDLVTRSENLKRKPRIKKEMCPQGHFYTEENTYTYPDGRYACKECVRKAGRAYQRRKREMKRGNGGK